MARAIKRPTLPKLPVKLPKLPRLPDPSEPDVFEEMTLLEHMEELRDRIVKVAIAVGLAFIAGLVIAGPLLEEIKVKANATEGLDVRSPTDTITIFMKIALYVAIAFALPIIIYQLVGFLAPGLTKKEKRILYTSLPFVTLLFLAGVAYAFFFAVPRALLFLSTWQQDVFQWQPDGNEVISFYLTVMLGLGIAFQLPLVMFLLAKLNVVTPKKMRQWRKYSILLILVASAIITPTADPFNMMLVAIPLVALYEVGILISYAFVRSSPKETPNPA